MPIDGRRAFVAASLLAPVALAACGGGGPVEGSGRTASAVRRVAPFERVVLTGAADMRIGVGGAQRVTVRGDDNLLPYVRTSSTGRTLTVSLRRSVRARSRLVVDVTAPALTGVRLEGAGDVRVLGLRARAFRAELTGAGILEASGRVDLLEARLAGAGSADLDRLTARAARVEVSGVGSARVRCTEALDATLTGIGEVTYSGHPRRVTTHVTGTGRVGPL
jgi:hypothetical protein